MSEPDSPPDRFTHRDHRARKRFGQNFLVRDDIIHRILQAVNAQAGEAVVEIGPGLGALTSALTDAAGALHVIEIDRDLAARLREKNDDRLTIHEMDVLKADFGSLLESVEANLKTKTTAPSKLRIVGNLPYNISTPLLLKLAHAHHVVHDLHVMLQLEVVERMVAESGTKAFGRLSAILQSVFHIEQILAVPPDAFKPAPKVQSAVARLTPRENIPSAETLRALEIATRIAFSNKRKTLRNNFKKILNEAQLEELNINPSARAETLHLDAFHRLAGVIVKLPSEQLP